MTNERRVDFSPDFTRDVKALKKRFRRVTDDVRGFVERLKQGETPGAQIQGVGYTVYKARLRNTDVQRGKSGGYRVIYYVKTMEAVVLLMIYTKTEREDISTNEIQRRIAKLSDDDTLSDNTPPE